MDQKKIQQAVRLYLEGIGEDPDRKELKDTPRRVSEMALELFSGMEKDPKKEMDVVFVEEYNELILVRDIPLYSMCEHHLLPFLGRAHIAYIPGGKVLGLSKLVRILDRHAKRLQIQERLTGQVADEIEQTANAVGVAVVLEAEHLCMTLRGVRRPGARTVTSALRGACKDKPEARAEVMALCAGR